MLNKRSNLLLLGAALALVMVAVLGYRIFPETLATVDTRPTSEGIADLSVQTLAGEQISLQDLQGQVVLVNFWATWCGTCRSEMPGFQAVYDDYKDEGFTILALSIDETGPATVDAFLRENGYSFPVGMATEEAQRRFGATGVPTSFLIDQQGEIREAIRGMLHEADLRAAVQGLLDSAPVS